jgi:hypothetical protein
VIGAAAAVPFYFYFQHFLASRPAARAPPGTGALLGQWLADFPMMSERIDDSS